MAGAVVDTTVLYAAANRREVHHDAGLAIVRAADRGDLPTLLVPDVVLVETMNGLTRDVGHAKAVDVLDRLRASSGFELVREPETVWRQGVDLFYDRATLSLADAVIAAGALQREIPYVYSFDAGFDGVEGLIRLDIAENPYM